MADNTGGTTERTGVTLVFKDEFTATVGQFSAKSTEIEQRMAAIERASLRQAGVAQKQAQGFKVSGEAVAKYSLAAAQCSGTMQRMGISNEIAAKSIGITTEALVGGLNPLMLTITAVGALATAIIAVANHQKSMEKATRTATEAIIQKAAQTGILRAEEAALLRHEKALIQQELVSIQLKIEKAKAMEIEIGLWNKIAIAALLAAKQYGRAAKLSAEWIASTNQKALAESLAKLRELEEKLAAINLAFAGGAEGAKRHEEAVTRAAEAEKAAINAAGDRIKWLTALQVAEDEKRAASAEAAAVKARAVMEQYHQDQVNALNKEAVDQAARVDRFKKVHSAISSGAQQLGAIMGQVAAGTAGAWKAALVMVVQMAGRAISAMILAWGAAQAAMGNVAGAMRAAIGAALVEGIFSGVASYLQARQAGGGAGGGGGTGGGGSTPRGATGPQIYGGSSSRSNVSFAPQFNLTMTLQGDVPADRAATARKEAFAMFDEHFGPWASRARKLGFGV